MNLTDACALAQEAVVIAGASNRQVTDRKQTEVWLDQGEQMAFVAANLPAELGRWYCRGVDDFGAAAVIQLLTGNALQNAPEFPWLARVKLHTVQNYAAVVRAIERDPRLRKYSFWHVEAILGVQEGERFVLLEAGLQEEMGAGKFRRYRDETLGTAKGFIRSEAQVNGQNEKLYHANRDLTDAVTGYAEDLAVIQQQCKDLQLALSLAQAEAENAEAEATTLRARLAMPEAREDEVIGYFAGTADHPLTEYRQTERQEWVDGDSTCPRCGGRLVCENERCRSGEA